MTEVFSGSARAGCPPLPAGARQQPLLSGVASPQRAGNRGQAVGTAGQPGRTVSWRRQPCCCWRAGPGCAFVFTPESCLLVKLVSFILTSRCPETPGCCAVGCPSVCRFSALCSAYFKQTLLLDWARSSERLSG